MLVMGRRSVVLLSDAQATMIPDAEEALIFKKNDFAKSFHNYAK
jgi:hypothetical protein